MDERHVYAADERDTVSAFDKTRGNNPWKQDKLRDRKLSSPVTVAERFVAVGDYQGQIHLIDTEDGAFAARAHRWQPDQQRHAAAQIGSDCADRERRHSSP
jgi:outer membrane protein assembly factor BamB